MTKTFFYLALPFCGLTLAANTQANPASGGFNTQQAPATAIYAEPDEAKQEALRDEYCTLVHYPEQNDIEFTYECDLEAIEEAVTQDRFW